MTGSTVGCTARTRWVGAGSTGDATAAAARELRRMEEAVVAARAGLRRAAEATWVGRAGRSYQADLDEQQQRLGRLLLDVEHARRVVLGHTAAADAAHAAGNPWVP